MAPINRMQAQRQTLSKSNGANGTMIEVDSEGKVSIKHSVESLFKPNLPLVVCPALFLSLTSAHAFGRRPPDEAHRKLDKVERGGGG